MRLRGRECVPLQVSRRCEQHADGRRTGCGHRTLRARRRHVCRDVPVGPPHAARPRPLGAQGPGRRRAGRDVRLRDGGGRGRHPAHRLQGAVRAGALREGNGRGRRAGQLPGGRRPLSGDGSGGRDGLALGGRRARRHGPPRRQGPLRVVRHPPAQPLRRGRVAGVASAAEGTRRAREADRDDGRTRLRATLRDDGRAVRRVVRRHGEGRRLRGLLPRREGAGRHGRADREADGDEGPF